MRIVILAGGEGTRMQPWTTFVPKCLLPISGKAVSRHIVEKLCQEGYKDIVLCINKQFQQQFQHEFRDVDIEFSVTDRPMGTAGEVYYALKNFPTTDDFMVVYADDLTVLNHKKMWKVHKTNNAFATIAVTKNVPLDVGIVKTEKDSIVNFKEKPLIKDLGLEDTYVWIGTAIFDTTLQSLFQPEKDIAKDILPSLITQGLKIGAFVSDSLWLDIGTLSHYKRALGVFE